jgi:hypothetical protein
MTQLRESSQGEVSLARLVRHHRNRLFHRSLWFPPGKNVRGTPKLKHRYSYVKVFLVFLFELSTSG